ncbi:MAG TPA: RluA family pseudouridine synthase [Candidatus Binatia bacterium]|nr:RluA family pseudouridine synthase [Candidatus Binatia bacterium]
MAAADPVTVVVPEHDAGTRLDRFVAALPGIGTRSRVQQLIDGGHVTVDGVSRKSSHPVRSGERVVVVVPPPVASTVEPEALELSVLYEDDALLAIDKPPGMVVHPAPGSPRGTVVNALLHRLGALDGVGATGRPGIVHRLDRDTSGVLLVARTAEALEGLARQFRQRTLAKRYLAVVHGRVEPASGVMDQAIGRHPVERKQMSVHSPRGRAAVTRWQVLEHLPDATLLRLAPETGRTHQIRVHLAALGHPIVADRVYGGGLRRAARLSDDALAACSRQALHAESIRFAHPLTGVEMTVAAPVPGDIRALVTALGGAGIA